MEGSLRFKIDWASLIAGSKFTVFAMFYFVFEGNFPSTSPRGAYIWRGLFSEFYGRYSRTFMCDYLSIATTPISDHILGGCLRKVRLYYKKKRERKIDRANLGSSRKIYEISSYTLLPKNTHSHLRLTSFLSRSFISSGLSSLCLVIVEDFVKRLLRKISDFDSTKTCKFTSTLNLLDFISVSVHNH